MNSFLLLALSTVFVIQDEAKLTPPRKSDTIEMEVDIRNEDWYPKPSKARIGKIGNAFKIADRASKEKDNDRSWLMYKLAISKADSAREPRVSHEFTRTLADKWDVPASFMPRWHANAIKWSGNDARIPEFAWLMLADIKRVRPNESIEQWSQAFQGLQKLAGEAESEYTRRACAVPFSEIKARLWIASKIADGDSDAEVFLAILTGDVADGILKLKSSANKELAELAAQVSNAEQGFSAAHQQLLTLLAGSRFEAAKLSGQRIFESWIPTLTPEQIQICQPICYFMTEPLPLRNDFSLPYHGHLRNGYHDLAKELKLPTGFSFDEETKSWSCEGRGSIEFPRLPFENYVAEVELVINKIDREVKLAFGSEDSAQIRFYKEGDNKIKARLIRRVGGRYNWKGGRSFTLGEKMVAKFYRTPERMFASINGKRMNSRTFGLGWHKFRITVEKGSKVTVSNIKTRPWLPGDREVLKKMNGGHKSIAMTKLAFHTTPIEDYKTYFNSLRGLSTKIKRSDSFVTPQQIVMRPIPSGRFERPGDKRSVFLSRDFYCSAHEITQLQFCEVMDYNPSSAQGNPYFPVDNVTMAEAKEFCARLTKQMASSDLVPEGYEYRLPTEAEWTFAAMADGKSELDVAEKEFWHWDSCEGGFRMVGTSSASKCGIYDMHGNVEELSLSKFHKRKSAKETKDDKELVDPVDAANNKNHIVVKGGSWNVGADRAAASRRERRHQGRTPGRGFRVVLAPKLNGKE